MNKLIGYFGLVVLILSSGFALHFVLKQVANSPWGELTVLLFWAYFIIYHFGYLDKIKESDEE